MKTLKLITLLILLCPFILKAQYSDFDLSRYKLPDIKLSRLDTYFNLGNYTGKSKYKRSWSDSTESRLGNFRGSMNFDYYHFRNKEKYQGELNALLSGDFHNLHSKNEFSNTINNSNSFNFNIFNTNKFYNENLKFIEIDPELSISRIATMRKDLPAPYEKTDETFQTELAFPISIGHGRIEPVEDLRLAIYILEELNKAGRIENLPSDDVILEMAKEISKIKHRRFFDERIMKMKELQVVDSFLIANNIISINDINYFVVLNDQWDYAYGPGRTTGFAVNVGIDDRISINRSHSIDATRDIKEEKDYVNTWYLGGFSQARYDKPINLYWQSSATLRIAYGYEYIKGSNAIDYKTGIFNTVLEYSIGFFPNTRTYARFKLAGNYYASKGDKTIANPAYVGDYKDNQLILNSGLEFSYYVSPQFRLRIDSNFRYYRLGYTDSLHPEIPARFLTNSINNDTGITLIYSFF